MGSDRGRVVLVTGVMAAGKSTVAQLLAERFERSAHLRGDRFRRMIVRGNAAPNTEAFEAELRVRYTLGAQSADGYADAGYTAVWQDCVIGPMLGEIETLVRTRPLDIIVLVRARTPGCAPDGSAGARATLRRDRHPAHRL
jgi:hypothetical protein